MKLKKDNAGKYSLWFSMTGVLFPIILFVIAFVLSKTDSFIADWLNSDTENSLVVVYVFVLVGAFFGLIAFCFGIFSILSKSKTRLQGAVGSVIGLVPLLVIAVFSFGLF